MKRLSVVELKNSLGKVLNQAESQGERVIVQRRGKDAAALISIEDLRLLERLTEEAEDRIDVEAANAALAEPGDPIPLEEFCRRHGIPDEPNPKRRRSNSKARSKAV